MCIRDRPIIVFGTIILLQIISIVSSNVSIKYSNFEVLNFFSDSLNKFLFSLFIIFAYFFSALSISEVFEDYIKDYKIKNVANGFLYVSAVVIPLITIILLINL